MSTAIRDASTVVLLRDGTGGIEVWLLTRVQEMAFAAGMSVFPGGGVDPADADLPFTAGAAEEVSVRFGCEARQARALLGAAVRETFEETGVLLTTPIVDLSDTRTDVEAGLVSFGEVLRANGLSIDTDVLHPWARWITPPGGTRRYDTRFFVGALPEGAQAQDVTTESSYATWIGIDEAIEQGRRGERGLMPPTMSTLNSLLSFTTVAEALASAGSRPLGAIQPTIRRVGGRILSELPDGTSFVVPNLVVP